MINLVSKSIFIIILVSKINNNLNKPLTFFKKLFKSLTFVSLQHESILSSYFNRLHLRTEN